MAAVDMSALSRMQIETFFAKIAPVTQEQCNREAQSITGSPVTPTACQGGTSYTVDAGQVVVQFRAAGSFLDMDFIRNIERTYEGFTPQHEDRGPFSCLRVYVMTNVGGISMYLARAHLQKNDYALLRRTIDDYARFFASAYSNTPGSMSRSDRSQLLDLYSSRLQQLRKGLPERFHKKLDTLIPQLPIIFDEDWPLMPNHVDLLENNIHVCPDTGAIMGICDWKDAEIGPFGISLGGLETMLGIRTVKDGSLGWSYFPKHQELRETFWTNFFRCLGGGSEAQMQRVEVARLVGLFLANGFAQDRGGNLVAATEESVDLRFLVKG